MLSLNNSSRSPQHHHQSGGNRNELPLAAEVYPEGRRPPRVLALCRPTPIVGRAPAIFKVVAPRTTEQKIMLVIDANFG